MKLYTIKQDISCLIPVIFLHGTLFLSCSASPPANLGHHNNQLSQCPDSPNCVTSFSDKSDSEHYIKPLVYKGSTQEAIKKLRKIVLNMEHSKILKKEPYYMHVEYTSALFRFIDDVEFLFMDKKKIIHLRSASRTGYSDLGVNRKRMETIRKLFNKK